MRIVSVLWDKSATTGAHKRLLYLLNGLSNRGNDAILITKEGGDFGLDKIETIELREGGIPSQKVDSVRALVHSNTFVEEKVREADVIVSFGLGGAVPGTYLKYRFGIPMLLALRSYPVENVVAQGRLKEAVRRIAVSTYLRGILMGIDRVVMQTEIQRKKLVQNYSVRQERTTVIRNNILGDLEEPSDSIRAEKLLFAGTLDYRKGIDTLLRALPSLVETENVHLHVAGRGPMKKDAERFVRKKSLGNHVTFHGYVTEIKSLMRKVDLVVIPSRFDSFPNVALEAMSVGTPFIVSDLPDVRSAFGRATQYVKANDCNSLARKLISLQNEDKYLKLKEKYIEQRKKFKFDWINKFEKEIEKVK
jgi:glycosyltransferase involved in cell wall biosynthesis